MRILICIYIWIFILSSITTFTTYSQNSLSAFLRLDFLQIDGLGEVDGLVECDELHELDELDPRNELDELDDRMNCMGKNFMSWTTWVNWMNGMEWPTE